MNQGTDPNQNDNRWRNLYKAGGIAAFAIAALLVGEIFVYGAFPQVDTIPDTFAIFNENWLVGLLNFDLLGMIAYILFIPMTLAIYLSVRRTSEAVSLIGTVLFFVGIAAFFATNTAFSMLSLSSQYAAAQSEAEKAMLLAAGRVMETLFDINAFQVSYVIVSASWVLIGAAMLRSGVFGKVCAWAGTLAGAAGIVAVAFEHSTVLPGYLTIAIAFYFAAIVFLLVWVIMTGRRLLRLGRMNQIAS